MKRLFSNVFLLSVLMFFSCTQASFLEKEAEKDDDLKSDIALQEIDFTISGENVVNVPLDTEFSTSLTLSNNADFEDSYSISVDSQLADVKLSKNMLTISGKSHKTITLTVKLTEEKSTVVKIICRSKINPDIEREFSIKLDTIDNDFSVTSDVSYYVKNIESKIKVEMTNNTKRTELIYLRFDKVPSFVWLKRLPMLIKMLPGEKVTLDFPYSVNVNCDNKITFDLIVYSGNGERKRQTKEITLWDLTSRLVSLTNEDDTKSQIDLTEEAKALQEKFRANDYIQANEIAGQIVSKLADFAGVEQTEPENDMYFIDADEPEVRIEVPQTPAIFSQNVGEFKIIAAEDAVSDACFQSGVTHPNNLFYIDGVAYYLQKNGQPYIPTKKFVKGVPLLKEDGTEKGTSYFKYEKTVTVNMKSHTTSGNSGGYEYDTFEEDQRKATEGYWKIQTASQQDSSGVTTSCTYALYSAHTAVCFEVTEEANDSREFLSELDNVPTDRIVIFTHGTLFYKWVAEAKQHGNYYMFCENGEGNTAAFFKQPSVAEALNLDYSQNDKAYYFNWSGENNYDHRDKAAVALEKFIYDKVASNLFNCRASQIILIGHSHGVTVNNITMHNLQTDKMETFAGEIPFVVGLNGIGTSTADIGDNEKSNRDCFKFPDKTFESLDGDKKVKMYNFYSNQDGVVPPAFDDTIIFSYNYEWEYTVQELLNYTTISIAEIFAIVQMVRFIVIGCTTGNYNTYRKEAQFLDNSFANINERDLKNSSHDDFYFTYMNPPVKLWNICDYIE
ncbi:MAG: hypothetical protein UHW86_03700, partial [Spirochaetota bacterium]|nr:hypothetical protein [Spirochaetota bacterium]